MDEKNILLDEYLHRFDSIQVQINFLLSQLSSIHESHLHAETDLINSLQASVDMLDDKLDKLHRRISIIEENNKVVNLVKQTRLNFIIGLVRYAPTILTLWTLLFTGAITLYHLKL